MKNIYRSKDYSMIGGVCGGLGEFIGIDPTLIRLIFIFLAFISGFCPLIITYLIGWVVIPFERKEEAVEVS